LIVVEANSRIAIHQRNGIRRAALLISVFVLSL